MWHSKKIKIKIKKTLFQLGTHNVASQTMSESFNPSEAWLPNKWPWLHHPHWAVVPIGSEEQRHGSRCLAWEILNRCRCILNLRPQRGWFSWTPKHCEWVPLTILSLWDINSKQIFGSKIIYIYSRKGGMPATCREEEHTFFWRSLCYQTPENYWTTSQLWLLTSWISE